MDVFKKPVDTALFTVENDSPAAASYRQPAKFNMPSSTKAPLSAQPVKTTVPPVKVYKPPPPVAHKSGKKESQSQAASSMVASVMASLFDDSDEDSPPVPPPVMAPKKIEPVEVEPVIDEDGFITAAPKAKSTLKRAGTAISGGVPKRSRTSLEESGLMIETPVGEKDVKVEEKKERKVLPMEEQSNQQFLEEMHRTRLEAAKEMAEPEIKEEKKKAKKKSKKQMEADRPKESRFAPIHGDVSVCHTFFLISRISRQSLRVMQRLILRI
jgi:hypothetical protein